MKIETIHWRQLPTDGMPDAEITVLAEVRDPDGEGTECWPAFWSGERWVDAAQGWPIGDAHVLAWADMPKGAQA